MNNLKIDPRYRIYLDKVFSLAKTLVIKSDAMAQSMNNRVRILTGNPDSVDEYDKSTWRYYMNICGEYHPQDLFELKGKIEIVSVDTLETIEFTKENLQLHKATRKEYQYGTRLYEELIIRYPRYEMLILGILYPANMQEAIDAPEGKILSFPPSLVEVNEYSFIHELQRWIDGYKLRWTNRHYSISDDYYDIANLGVMYVNLVGAILTIRKAKCKTNEAHSYHVRQFLASHGFLDDYLDVLTLKQRLRFYRNICYIERNIGKVSTFEWLTENVMTERKLPLSEYSMYHNTEEMAKDIYPVPFFKKKSLNGLEWVSDDDDKSVSEMLDAEEPLARGNQLFRMDNEVAIYDKLKSSRSNKVKTKVLESKAIDYSNAQHFKQIDTLLALWLEWSDKNIYRAFIPFVNLKTGEKIALKAKDAFYLYWYCFNMAMGFKPEVLPTLLAERIPIYPIPSREHVFAVVPNEPKLVNETHAVHQSFYDKITEMMPTLQVVISIEDFFNKANEVNRVANEQYNFTIDEREVNRRAYKEAMIHRLYADRYVSPDRPQSYDNWLEDKGIKLGQLTKHEWYASAVEIMRTATGLNLDTTVSLRALQAAMIRLMKQLSSYSIQYIKEINENDLLIFELLGIRTTDISTKTDTDLDAPLGLEVVKVETTTTSLVQSENTGQDDSIDLHQQLIPISTLFAESKTKVIASTQGHVTYHLSALVDAWVITESMQNNPRGLIDIGGMADYNRLPLSIQAQAIDLDGRDYYYHRECDGELHDQEPNDWYLNRDLQGFDYKDKIDMDIKPVHGFDYDDKPEHQLNTVIGFDYDNEPYVKLKPVNGFTYQDEKPSIDLNGLDGFKYDDVRSTNLHPVNGFSYNDIESMTLKPLKGFNYQDSKPTATLNPLDGFKDIAIETHKLKPLDGFNYDDEVGLNPAKGFTYLVERLPQKLKPLDGFTY